MAFSIFGSIINNIKPVDQAPQVEQHNGTGALVTLAPEIISLIAHEIDSGKDLGAYRLASKVTAAMGKFEVERRLRRTEQIATKAPGTSAQAPRNNSANQQLCDLATLFPPRCIENITFVNINVRGFHATIDAAMRTVTFPRLQKLQVQHATFKSASSTQSMLIRHAATLEELKLLYCTIVVADDSLYQTRVWRNASRTTWMALIAQLYRPMFMRFENLECLALDVQPIQGRAGCRDCLQIRNSATMRPVPGRITQPDWPRQAVFYNQPDGERRHRPARSSEPQVWPACNGCKMDIERENAEV